ncbi:MAG: SusC/RagA family TonB-linked outer membrane protein [Bacteroidales bacterium]|nr:SusC/RagA family TonB-linked outer membrane protein [Bacteroidales bacterium]MDT8374170.1 SusC/RagA family TonB-linked outer membrane protein [Bacteroidales bacterium]
MTEWCKRFILSVFALLLVSWTLSAQNTRVTGKVTDNAGLPIPGVTVLIEGTTTGVATDYDGTYSIEVPSNGVLLFSAIGMESERVPVNNRSVINLTMVESSVMVEEVVVTALGIEKEKKALGYAVQDLKSDEIMRNKQTNIINSLAGKVAGVNITQSSGSAGSGSTIIIRGGNSASESRDNQPLFVVDGIIYDNSTVNSGNSGTDGVTKVNTSFGNRVMDINPDDIESMSILKGAAASALYGSRAADGVVVITTKRGSEGPIKIDFNSKYSYSWTGILPELQGVYGRGFYNQAGVFSDFTTQSWGNPITGTVYDNVGNFFQGGNVFDNSLSISGGSKSNSFYLSVSNFDQTGVVPLTGYDKTTFRFNGEQKYGKLTVGANAAYSISNTAKTLTSAGLYNGGGNGTMTATYGWARSDDMSRYLNEDGSKYRRFEGLLELADEVENPYWIINKNKLTDEVNRFTGGINASIDVTEWFNIIYRVGYDTYKSGAFTYIAPGGSVLEKYQDGRLSKSSSDYEFITSNLMLNFNKSVGDFDLNLLLGHTVENTNRVLRTNWGYGFSTAGTISFANIVDDTKFFTERNVTKRLVGAFGEFRASYKSIAYLTVTGRNDWSSTLPIENRSYFYPSVSGSLVFTELLPKNDILSFGKIRASWAQVGKDAGAYATNTYLWAPQVVSAQFVGTGNSWTGGSPNLVPEIQTSTEFGTELQFLQGRLGLDFTYYTSVTKNQLASPRLAQSTGFIFLTLNSGSVHNKGMELSINATPVKSQDFTWDLTLNLSGNRGTLGEFLPGVGLFYVTDVQIGGVKAASIPNGGYFLGLTGDYWEREKDEEDNEIPDGRYLIDEVTGLYKNTKVTTNVIGNREPDFIGGLNNNFRYKNLNFSLLFDIRKGGDIYNGTEYFLTVNGLSMRTLDRESVTVTGVSSSTNEPLSYTYQAGQTYNIGGASYSGEYMIQQYWLNYANNAYNFMTSTNWLRLRSMSLSYDFGGLLGNNKYIKGLSASVAGYNLWLWTNYKGMDPEVSVSGSGTGGSGSMGIDYCGVPATRNVTFGLNVTF